MPANKASASVKTAWNLSSLDKVALADLLQHTIQLFVAACTVEIADKNYIESLKTEIEKIQTELKNRPG